ncbi:MAG: 4-(cytidine 5'-diphospho)-2-C-methyl-D-erythritol kinase [Gammaproteobacteria bacterium]|nr:4-(cytidine 5'-diphospho)-2-C-methyl-D-erythritol kinase [Gammaproteobacteria bacterium]
MLYQYPTTPGEKCGLSSTVWPAPAKLNLMLHITGRRSDGYHEIQTVFQFLDLCDELQFDIRHDGRISRPNGPADIEEADDLVVRSAKALQKASATDLGVEIRLNKRIPVGAGLGGGSSDAATTLHALNRLWQLNFEVDRLAAIGLSLGADVPVFVRGFAAFAEGIGERLQPVSIEPHWYLLITPDVHVSTAEIFADPDLTRDCPAIKICDLSTIGWDNVCVPVVTKHYPKVAKAMNISSGFAEARMSGTGATVFAQFTSKNEAEQLRQRLLATEDWSNAWRTFICQGRNQSPLLSFMKTL